MAAVAVFLTVSATTAPPPDGAPALVATRDLPAGHVVRAGDVRVATWPEEVRAPSLLSSPEQVVGRPLSSGVGVGEPLTETRVLGPGLLAGQPPGQVAAHVIVADPSSAAMARAGDHVDVLSGTGEVVVADAVVLAVDSPAEGGAMWSGASGSAGMGAPGSGLVLAVDPREASAITRQSGGDPYAVGLAVVLRPGR
jgi:Flp pilus assembly protein CpaB